MSSFRHSIDLSDEDNIVELQLQNNIRDDYEDFERTLSESNSVQYNGRNLMSIKNPPRNLWRVATSCLWACSAGFSDAAPGALLPSIEKHYNIGYAIVSLIWILNALGYIFVAMLSHKIQPWFGKQKSMCLCCCCSLIMYALVSSAVPFPVVVVGFFFGGIGLAIGDAQSNVFLSKFDKNSKYLAFFHGLYSVGATISPIAATSMVTNGMKWNYVYFISLGLMTLNLISLWFAFIGADQDLKPWDSEVVVPNNDSSSRADVALEDLNNQKPKIKEIERSSTSQPESIMKLALKSKITWIIAIFLFFYQGCEVAIGGWIVSYLVEYRHTNMTYGYVLSGYWAGLTIGRLFLTRPLHKYIGTRRSIIVISLLSIFFVILTWVIKVNVALGVFIGLTGIFVGPTYPLMVTAASALLPRKIQLVSLTIITAVGTSGGALVPFFVGLISQVGGTYVVLPIFIAAYSVMIIFWLLLPNFERKLDSLQNVNKIQKFWYWIW